MKIWNRPVVLSDGDSEQTGYSMPLRSRTAQLFYIKVLTLGEVELTGGISASSNGDDMLKP